MEHVYKHGQHALIDAPADHSSPDPRPLTSNHFCSLRHFVIKLHPLIMDMFKNLVGGNKQKPAKEGQQDDYVDKGAHG
jgi:hypothetical protein